MRDGKSVINTTYNQGCLIPWIEINCKNRCYLKSLWIMVLYMEEYAHKVAKEILFTVMVAACFIVYMCIFDTPPSSPFRNEDIVCFNLVKNGERFRSVS